VPQLWVSGFSIRSTTTTETEQISIQTYQILLEIKCLKNLLKFLTPSTKRCAFADEEES
jgi:hypothetical protein